MEPFIAQRVLEAFKMTESVGLNMGEMTQKINARMTQKENRNLAQGLYTSPKVSNKLSFHYQISVEFELLGTKTWMHKTYF